MTKKNLKLLAQKSFKGNYMDPKKIKKIASLLKRSELRNYLNFLRLQDLQKKITVITPEAAKGLQKTLSKMYPNRRINYAEDPSIILGIKVIDNDTIYELDLKDTLNSLKDYIKQYDN